jgi:sigma-B regulation protein RsbU (phosphoserine phosphatase)
MFFRRAKKVVSSPENDPRQLDNDHLLPEGQALEGDLAGASTLFLTGNQNDDRHRVEVLLGAIASVAETRDIEPLLNDIVDRSIEATGAERGFLLLTTDSGSLDIRVARGKDALDLRKGDEGGLRFSTSIAQKVLKSNDPMRATASTENEAMDLGQSVFALKLRAAMCVPLAASRDSEQAVTPLGVLYVDSRAENRSFSNSDLSFFAALAKHISISLENAKLHIDSLEKVKLEQSLELASAIQRDLIPDLPEFCRGFELGGFFQPADLTGGDFFDIVPLDGERLALVVGDVSGHGIGPALITASAQASLRSYLRVVPDIGQVVTLLNKDLSERIADNRFMTLMVGILLQDGTLEVVNGGHADPMIWRAATGEVETLLGGGPALGMIDDFSYKVSSTVKLCPGDVLVAFSDGFSEARDPEDHDRMLGEDGIALELKSAAEAGLNARAIASQLVDAALSICRELREDDMTLLVVRHPSSH